MAPSKNLAWPPRPLRAKDHDQTVTTTVLIIGHSHCRGQLEKLDIQFMQHVRYKRFFGSEQHQPVTWLYTIWYTCATKSDFCPRNVA